MARIIGGIACSHTPTIGFAHDKSSSDDPIWGPVINGFAPVKGWLKDKQPDVAIFVYNDHITSFFFDHYSTFALGIGARHEVADEGGGPRGLPAGEVRDAHVAHAPCTHSYVERGQRLLNGRVLVKPVHLPQIDVVGTQSFE